MTLTTVDLTPRIGTEIRADRADLIAGVHSAELRRLLEARGVLVVRNLFLEKEEQLAFAKTIGGVQAIGGNSIFKISLDPKENPGAEYLKGSFFWHIDGSTDEIPNLAAMLNAQTLSPSGGQTLFANTYAAWDDLPEEDKAACEGLRARHSLECAQRMVNPEPSPQELAIWQARPSRAHPIVWTHKSGRKSLVLGATADYIEDMPIAEGRALLCKLRGWATQPQFVYRHEWQLGDLLIWDNTGTMHRVEPYPLDCGRLMHRSTIEGEEALV
jgi:alpha-ketoglutarate-dependent taurine dioxygenase